MQVFNNANSLTKPCSTHVEKAEGKGEASILVGMTKGTQSSCGRRDAAESGGQG